MRCMETMNILEILRLTVLGYSKRDIGNSIGKSKSAVGTGTVQKRYKEHKLSYNIAHEMTNSDLQDLIYPNYSKKIYVKENPDFDYINFELKKHKTLNLRFLWEEYKAENLNELEYSQFCYRYKVWKDQSGKDLSMYQERKLGKELFIDWMGNTFSGVVDSETGEVFTAHIFVATLGTSGMPYVEAFPDEKKDNCMRKKL